MDLVSEKRRHDEINLKRLIRRLEKSVLKENWDEAVTEDDVTWRKSVSTLQTVRFAKSLLKNVELTEDDYSNASHYDDIKASLDRMEVLLKSVQERTAPKPKRPKSLLSQLPIPVLPEQASETATEEQSNASPNDADTVPVPVDNLLTSPADPTPTPFISPIPSLIPPTLPATATGSTAVATGSNSHFLQNSKTQQEELKNQLAMMSTQLRRNAMAFSEKLAKDQAVVEDAHQKLESNFDVMKATRIRVRDHRGKSGSTTCLVIFSVLGVTVLFVLMVFIMRFT
ncbi:hypothetical protein K435DRAFT_863908 [Dendrothele bispora CBS 962.96]|uniref:Vesicle transport protein USE1 n=1 Tax=Dendrothele bispora (strain CBS 962.96) TaxID=1314807 RepID=A0A4S8LNZ9_DENBC|nr:hypothetical protein K435DRAFT_863908 [Dendrothele bispora CBS 962.96]